MGETLLAGKIEAEDEREDQTEAESPEVRIEGLIDSIQSDESGRIVEVTVGGLQVMIGDFADIEGVLEEGGRIEIKAVILNGTLIAARVEVEERKGKRQVKGRDEDRQRGKDKGNRGDKDGGNGSDKKANSQGFKANGEGTGEDNGNDSDNAENANRPDRDDEDDDQDEPLSSSADGDEERDQES